MEREMKEEREKMNEWEKKSNATCKVQMRGYYNWMSDNSLNKRRPKLEIFKKKKNNIDFLKDRSRSTNTKIPTA